MCRNLDGSLVKSRLDPLPCGGVPIFNIHTGYGYICETCLCTVGSADMPSNCYEAYKKKRDIKDV